MLEYLKLENVGPAEELEVDLAPRLNFLTGDNGLGKTFLLDTAWWVLTRTWARVLVAPQNGGTEEAYIKYRCRDVNGSEESGYVFNRRRQKWDRSAPDLEYPSVRGIVVYAQVDGGFSVWDPARTVLGAAGKEEPRPAAYLFKPEEVWDGLPRDAPKKLCNGLIHDWTLWLEREKSEAFRQLTRVLRQLSPSPEETLVPGDLRRVSLDDVRDHPTLRMPYGHDVPLVRASAGMRRIVALSYLLVWAWQEHLRASEMIGEEPVRQIIFLVDEIEAHLHPQWQRRIAPALLDVMTALTGEAEISVQLVAATHSPLVLASIEPYFDRDTDAVWSLDLVGGEVKLTRSEWHRYGDVNSWLSSGIFDLAEPRSLEAEEAIGEAEELLRRRPVPSLAEFLKVDEELRRVLSGVDRFWIRWSAFVEEVRKSS